MWLNFISETDTDDAASSFRMLDFGKEVFFCACISGKEVISLALVSGREVFSGPSIL